MLKFNTDSTPEPGRSVTAQWSWVTINLTFYVCTLIEKHKREIAECNKEFALSSINIKKKSPNVKGICTLIEKQKRNRECNKKFALLSINIKKRNCKSNKEFADLSINTKKKSRM